MGGGGCNSAHCPHTHSNIILGVINHTPIDALLPCIDALLPCIDALLPWKRATSDSGIHSTKFVAKSISALKQHRFQIFKKLGVKFYDLFLWTEQLQWNVDFFRVNLPLDFSEIFNIFRITVFFFFSKNLGKFLKKLKTVAISENHSFWMPTIWYQAKLFQSSGL